MRSTNPQTSSSEQGKKVGNPEELDSERFVGGRVGGDQLVGGRVGGEQLVGGRVGGEPKQQQVMIGKSEVVAIKLRARDKAIKPR